MLKILPEVVTFAKSEHRVTLRLVYSSFVGTFTSLFKNLMFNLLLLVTVNFFFFQHYLLRGKKKSVSAQDFLHNRS